MRTKLYHRLTAALCALVLLLGLSACGGGKEKPQPDVIFQGEEGAPIDVPQPEKTDKTEGELPLTLGAYVKSDGLHILYENAEGGLTGLAKDKKPYRLYIFEDGELSIQRSPAKTYGELSAMTDREIADEVYADPDAVRNSPYYTYVKTDNSGNYVASEGIAFCMQYVGRLDIKYIIPGWKSTVSGEVYTSKYTGYMGDTTYTYFTRGEMFLRDAIDSEYVVVDPADNDAYLPTAAVSLLYDGTIVPAPEDGSLFAVQPMTGSRMLGAEDIQYTQDYTEWLGFVMDVSPFAAEDWFISEGALDIYVILSNDPFSLWSGGYALYQAGLNLYFRANPTAETLPLSQTVPVAIRYDAGGSPISIPAGTIESRQDLWTLYGEPHGALVQWSESLSSVTNYYYWKGSRDGVDFFLLYEDDGRDNPLWRYVQVCDTGLSIFEEDLRNELVVERALIELAG